MDGTGYDIKKLLEQAFSHFNKVHSITEAGRQTFQNELDCIETNRTKLLAEHTEIPDGWREDKT